MSFKNKELDCSNDFDRDDVHHGNCMIVSLFKLGETKNDLDNLEEKVDDDRLVKKELTPNWDSARPASELDRAATKLQKLYKSYRTRRNLDDCAVVAEELWCKGRDFEALKRISVSFFDSIQSETTVSRWARASVRAAKVGKDLSKNEKAQKLAQTYNWLEAIDPYHRYGHNLRQYYNVWFQSETIQPFFHWLDIGDGKELNLENCPRTKLQQQCVKYLGPEEREAYEVVMESGKLVYKQSRVCVDTSTDAEWIFVLSTSMNFYVGEKKRGHFHHSSFLSGAATIASGRLVAHNGILEAIWSYSGHYRPTEETLIELCRFLEEYHVDLTNVKKSPIDEDNPPKHPDQKDPNSDPTTDANTLQKTTSIPIEANIEAIEANVIEERNKTHMVGDHDHHQEEELQVFIGVGINNRPCHANGPQEQAQESNVLGITQQS